MKPPLDYDILSCLSIDNRLHAFVPVALMSSNLNFEMEKQKMVIEYELTQTPYKGSKKKEEMKAINWNHYCQDNYGCLYI